MFTVGRDDFNDIISYIIIQNIAKRAKIQKQLTVKPSIICYVYILQNTHAQFQNDWLNIVGGNEFRSCYISHNISKYSNIRNTKNKWFDRQNEHNPLFLYPIKDDDNNQ